MLWQKTRLAQCGFQMTVVKRKTRPLLSTAPSIPALPSSDSQSGRETSEPRRSEQHQEKGVRQLSDSLFEIDGQSGAAGFVELTDG